MKSPKMSLLINRFLVIILKLIPNRLITRILVVIQSHPQIADTWGYFIRKIHYYEPLPDFSQIELKQFSKKTDFRHINFNWEIQLKYLEKLEKYGQEIQCLSSSNNDNMFDFYNDTYRELDAAIYYAIIREIKPIKVIEIGSGKSTIIANIGLMKNKEEGSKGNLICIEPYPPKYLIDACQLDVEIIQSTLENIDLEFFDKLQAGDILFIDSTHTVKFNSDCVKEILNILPRLPKGVFVHIHDIFFPYDYPPQWIIEERRAWNEQYLLEAFLAYNSSFEIILANNWLTIDYPEKVAKIWTNLLNSKNTHSAGGFWIRKV